MDVKFKLPLASLDAVKDFLQVILPEYQWYIQHTKNSIDHLPTEIRSALCELEVEDYSKLYLDLPAVNKMFGELFLKEIDFNREIKNIDPAKVPKNSPLDEFLNHLRIISNDRDELSQINLEASDEEEREFLKCFLTWIMVWIHDLTALMVFGERLTSIATKAVSGDRTAIFKLVQIDPSTLRHLPAIAEQYQRAAIQKDKYFLKSFNHHLCNRVGTSKLKHNLVYVPLFLLHTLRLLNNMTNKQLLNFCDDAGLINYEEIPDARTMGIIRNRFLQGVR